MGTVGAGVTAMDGVREGLGVNGTEEGTGEGVGGGGVGVSPGVGVSEGVEESEGVEVSEGVDDSELGVEEGVDESVEGVEGCSTSGAGAGWTDESSKNLRSYRTTVSSSIGLTLENSSMNSTMSGFESFPGSERRRKKCRCW